jgi:uncharacterized protein YegJ (DUF2314 family)
MNNAAIRIIAIIIVAAIAIGARYAVRNRQAPSGGGNVVRLDGGDPGLFKAELEARNRWPEFLAAYQNKKPDQTFVVKHGFKVRGGGTEYLWVEVDSVQRTTVRGKLTNKPIGFIGHKLGDVVTVEQSEIADWVYSDGEKMIGGFSEKVLREIKGR